MYIPPASKASWEVANLTERKNPHAPLYGVKEFVRLSVCLFDFDPNYFRTGRTKWAEILTGHLWQNECSLKKFCPKIGGQGQDRGPKQQHFDQISQLFDMGSR